MPELKKTRRCSIPRCFGTQTLTEIGNTGIPIPRAIEDRGFEKARYRKYRVWLCDRDPMHITRVEDIFTPIRPCTACGAPSFYTMRLHRRITVAAARPVRKEYAQDEPGVGWRCFEHPDHLEDNG